MFDVGQVIPPLSQQGSTIRVAPSEVRAALVRLSAHMPLTRPERIAWRAKKARRLAASRWAGVLAIGVSVAIALVAVDLTGSTGMETLLDLLLSALIIWICIAAPVLLVVGTLRALTSATADLDVDPISPYWRAELERNTSRIPEIEAVRLRWIGDVEELTSAEYHALMDAVRLVEGGSSDTSCPGVPSRPIQPERP